MLLYTNPPEKNMKIDELHNKVNDPQVAQLLDKILDAVLALKARLADSNMDSNSIGGILIPPLSPYNIPMGTRPRTKALKADQLKGELKGDLKRAKMIGEFQDKVHPLKDGDQLQPSTPLKPPSPT
jgi:hypothetical protein